jgi:hypothetical protein
MRQFQSCAYHKREVELNGTPLAAYRSIVLRTTCDGCIEQVVQSTKVVLDAVTYEELGKIVTRLDLNEK